MITITFQSHADADVDDVLEGFNIPDTALPSSKADTQKTALTENKTPSFSSHLFGSLSFNTIYAYQGHSSISNNTDFHGITSLKPSLDLGVDTRYKESLRAFIRAHGYYDFAISLQDRDNDNAEIVDAYQEEIALGEAYVSARLSSKLNLKSGRQITSFGKATLLPVIDHFNSVDLRKPGLTELEYRHLPVALTRLDYSHRNWRLTGLATHEFRPNKYPPYGSDFYPFTFLLPPLESVRKGANHQSYGLFAGTMLNGWDLNFAFTSFLEEQPLLGLTQEIDDRKVNRHHLGGLSMDRTLKNWLFKMDVAYSDNRRFYALPDQRSSQLDLVLGTEYNGFRNTYIIFELLYRHLFNLNLPATETDDMPKENGLAWSCLISRSFFSELLKLDLYTLNLGVDFSTGSIQKLTLTYRYTDAVSLSAGIINYEEGDYFPLKEIGQNDRVFFNITYAF